jgi:hypothetical protein
MSSGHGSDDRPTRTAPPAFAPGEPVAERLAALFAALATEFAVLHERVDTLERVLAGHGAMPPDAIETYVPDAAAAAPRQAWRQQFLERVFAELQAEAEAAALRLPE